MEDVSLMLEVEEGESQYIDWSTTNVKTEPVDDDVGASSGSLTTNAEYNLNPIGSLHAYSQESGLPSLDSNTFVNDGHKAIHNIITEIHDAKFDRAKMAVKDETGSENDEKDSEMRAVSGLQTVKQEPIDDVDDDSHEQMDEEVAYSEREPGADDTKTFYSCDICGRFYQHQSSLTTHKKKHVAEERSHVCGICGKGFFLKTDLTSHMRIHTEKRNHVCETCGLGFRQRSFLVYHLRVHTGEKPYQCNNCDSRFRTSNGLREHSRTHTGVKPYSCMICGQCFSQSGSLKSHLRTHTGEKPYKCEICNKAFSLSTTLTRHIQTHTKCEKFKCEICNKFLSSLKYLKCHMLKQHMIEDAS